MSLEEGIERLQSVKRLMECLLEDCGDDVAAAKLFTDILNEIHSTIEAVTSLKMTYDDYNEFSELLGKE